MLADTFSLYLCATEVVLSLLLNSPLCSIPQPPCRPTYHKDVDHLSYLGTHYSHIVGSLCVGSLRTFLPVHTDAVHLLHLEHVLGLERYSIAVGHGGHLSARGQKGPLCLVAGVLRWAGLSSGDPEVQKSKSSSREHLHPKDGGKAGPSDCFN